MPGPSSPKADLSVGTPLAALILLQPCSLSSLPVVYPR